MDRDVGPAVEHGLLDLLDEHPLAADRVQRHRLIAVARGLDGTSSVARPVAAVIAVGDDRGLGERLRAAAGGEPERAAAVTRQGYRVRTDR